MAKLLKKSPPKSSMSRLLNSNAIADALSDVVEESSSEEQMDSPPALRVIESSRTQIERTEAMLAEAMLIEAARVDTQRMTAPTTEVTTQIEAVSVSVTQPAQAQSVAEVEQKAEQQAELQTAMRQPPQKEVRTLKLAPGSTANVAKTNPKSSLIRGGELYLTERSDQILNELVSIFKMNTNKAVAPTHLLRGILLALQPYISQIRREAAEQGPLKRPANESQYALEREEFERMIGQMVVKAVRG